VTLTFDHLLRVSACRATAVNNMSTESGSDSSSLFPFGAWTHRHTQSQTQLITLPTTRLPPTLVITVSQNGDCEVSVWGGKTDSPWKVSCWTFSPYLVRLGLQFGVRSVGLGLGGGMFRRGTVQRGKLSISHVLVLAVDLASGVLPARCCLSVHSSPQQNHRRRRRLQKRHSAR